ncbi:hypothetical protein [Inhella sp.]|uniref:hypothetical protein n=1 Tax=Inhella sp. TaxID=1921806 RepID=UPI0035AF482B
MRRIHDSAKYDELQHTMAVALVEDINNKLKAAGLIGEVLRDTVESLAFSVGALVDGSVYIEGPDEYIVPILGFARGRMRDKLLIPEEGGSSIHEFIPGVVAEVFAKQGASC